jgi:transcription-repair coupling factor (superfamily II helicase)
LEQNFANSFEYVYTDDQLNIINDIYKDMESDLPMDRLLSGDV